jgi:hypothetical protein
MRACSLRSDPSRVGKLGGGKGATIQKRRQYRRSRRLPEEGGNFGCERAGDHGGNLAPEPSMASMNYFDRDRSGKPRKAAESEPHQLCATIMETTSHSDYLGAVQPNPYSGEVAECRPQPATPRGHWPSTGLHDVFGPKRNSAALRAKELIWRMGLIKK